MVPIFEKSIRSGITQAVKPRTKKYMEEHCNPDEKSTYLQYLDLSNLYRWAMIQKLPKHGLNGKKNLMTLIILTLKK